MAIVGILLLIFLSSFHVGEVVAAGHRSKPASSGFRSSVVLPVYGKVYPLGYYSVSLYIGNPPKHYDFDIDTGSDLTWVQCDAPCKGCTMPRDLQYRPRSLVTCPEPLCSDLHWPQSPDCTDGEDQCDYEVQYADHFSSLNALVIDNFSFKLFNGSVVHPPMAFGCGYDQQYPSSDPFPPTAGIIGLGKGKISISSQLNSKAITRNVIGHCLSTKGGGFLFFGDDLIPDSGVFWTEMLQISPDKHYSAGPAELLYDAKPTGVRSLTLIFDSGSSYTYFNSKAYDSILDLIKSNLKGKALEDAKEDPTLPVCWKGTKQFKSVADVRDYFKTIAMRFKGSKAAKLEVPPEAYLIISDHGNLCLGILKAAEVGLGDHNVIGDIFMQNLMVIYDNEKQKIGWVPMNCDRLPGVDGKHIGELSEPFTSRFGVADDSIRKKGVSRNKNWAQIREL